MKNIEIDGKSFINDDRSEISNYDNKSEIVIYYRPEVIYGYECGTVCRLFWVLQQIIKTKVSATTGSKMVSFLQVDSVCI